MEIGCECGVDVNQRPRNYTRTTIRRIPGLQIFRYFCKTCKETFGFYAKGIIPECSYPQWDHLGATHSMVLGYRDKLRDEYDIEAEPMGGSWAGYLDILVWEFWNEDWGDAESISGGPIPIFRGHATMDEVLDVIDPNRMGTL